MEDLAEPLEDAAQPADVLGVTLPTCRLQASSVQSAGGAGLPQRRPPLWDDPPLFPVRGADQPVPATDVFR